jgi:hypothetical protein
MTPEQNSREELAAALATRRELGAEYDRELVEGFLDRVERGLDARIDQRLAERWPQSQGGGHSSGLALPLASLGIRIPLSAIAGGIAHLPGLMVAWIGIVLVNVAHALRPGDRPPPRR